MRAVAGTLINAGQGRMAALHARGELALNQTFVHESIIGTRFTGRLTDVVPDHPNAAVRPGICGRAWITGMGQLVLDDSDPFPEGYTLADRDGYPQSVADAPNTGKRHRGFRISARSGRG